jgi:hypothetical protein
MANDLLELLARPDALGDRTQAERARSPHGGEQAPLTRAVGETPDERAVDLELSTGTQSTSPATRFPRASARVARLRTPTSSPSVARNIPQSRARRRGCSRSRARRRVLELEQPGAGRRGRS